MTWAIGDVVLLLVGLPLAAVWWSRRAVWTRLRPGHERDPFGDTMRRHGLGPAAMARVENAVLWGKRLDDPAERAAVVDLARAGMPRWPTGQGGRVLLVLLAVWLAGALANVLWAVVQGRWGDVPWSAVVIGLAFSWGAAAPARAISRNTDPAPSDPPPSDPPPSDVR